MAAIKSKLIGGNFLFSETDIKDVFIPEEFTEEQKMIWQTVYDFCMQEIHGMGFEKIALMDAEKDKDKVYEIFKKAGVGSGVLYFLCIIQKVCKVTGVHFHSFREIVIYQAVGPVQ